VLDQVPARDIGVLHHDLQSLLRAGLHRGDPRPECDGARRARRRELDEPQVLVHLDVDVGMEPDPVDIEGDGAVHVGHRDGDELETHRESLVAGSRAGLTAGNGRRHGVAVGDAGDAHVDLAAVGEWRAWRRMTAR
jgi:hypothetical protein